MTKAHLKRINAPNTWNISRKQNKYAARPRAGPHNMKESMALVAVLRDILKITNTLKETKIILNNGEITVNGKIRKDPKFPVGLFDCLESPKIKLHYRCILNKKGNLEYIKMDKSESNIKIVKIIGKSKVKGKTQLNMNDGRNILIEKDDYKVGDSLVIEVPKSEIKAHIKLEKGATILLTGGKNAGKIGILEDILGDKITYKTKGSALNETLKKYAFPLGKEKTEIKLE